MFRRRRSRGWLALAALASVVALVAAGCAEESPVVEDTGASAGLAITTTAALPSAASPVTTTTTMAPAGEAAPDEEMGHGDDQMAHDDETGHDPEEPAHDEEPGGDQGEGAEHDQDEPAEFDREITVVITEFAFEPATIAVSAGETVRFVLVNQGAVPHEFRLTTAHAAAEHVASGHEGHGDEGEGGHGHEETLLEVAAGATDHLTVTFAEDAEWDQIACLIPGHYEAGMFGELEIS